MCPVNGYLHNKPPRSETEIREQLNDLDIVRKKAEEYGARDPASRMTLEAIVRQRADLLEELDAAEFLSTDADAEFGFEGEPVKGYNIDLGFLGESLKKIQDLTFSLAQVIIGEPTGRAPIPANILEESRFFVTSFARSSFKVRVKVLRTAEEKLVGFEPVYVDILKAVSQLLDEGQPLQEISGLIKHPRVKTHYSSLIDLVTTRSATIKLRYRNKPYAVRLSPQKALERKEWLKYVETGEETKRYEGVLEGGSISRDTFELMTPSGLISGKVSQKAQEQMKNLHWGERVIAEIRVTVSELEAGVMEPKFTYYAESFEPLPHLIDVFSD